MTPSEVLEKIARGDVYVIHVTFPEGLTIWDMASIFASAGLGAATDFVQTAGDASSIRDLDRDAKSLEGYLFPETYSVPRRTDAAALVRMMVSRFGRVFTPEMRQAAERQGLSIHDVVTVASIVEKETARPEERPLVAAVCRNRLRIGMALQSDPTGDLRARATGRVHRESPARRPALRLTVQHLPLRGPSSRTDRISWQGVSGGESPSRRRRLPLFRQQERRDARVRPHARRARSKCLQVPGEVLPGSQGASGGEIARVRQVRRAVVGPTISRFPNPSSTLHSSYRSPHLSFWRSTSK